MLKIMKAWRKDSGWKNLYERQLIVGTGVCQIWKGEYGHKWHTSIASRICETREEIQSFVDKLLKREGYYLC